MRRREVAVGGLAAGVLGGPLPRAAAAAGAPVLAAVAANFAAPMQRIGQAFERDGGARVAAAFGATGALYAQIRHGAPFEVLLAADAQVPQRLIDEGLAVAGSRFTYAVGRLVLWSRDPQAVDPAGEVLRSPRWRHLALADPRLAPYGAAAVQVLQRLGLLEAVRPRLVQGDSVAQAHQFVATGNAELGLIALSQVWSDGRLAPGGSAWLVPASLHDPIRQDAVLLARGRDRPEAAALLAYLRGAPARSIAAAAGYAG